MQSPLFFLLFCLGAQISSAQIVFEHAYPAGRLVRILLDESGETYVHNSATLYNKDHEFITEMPLDYAVSMVFSEKLLNNDPEVEAVFAWFEDVCIEGLGMWKGDQYTHLANKVENILIDSLPNEPLKLVIGRKVFTLPDFTLEHTYPNSQVKRHEFPQQGKFFVSYDISGFDGFHFYNLNHGYVKSVFQNMPELGTHNFISENFFNQDSQLEFMGTRWNGGADIFGNRKTLEVVTENEQVLFSEPCEHAQFFQAPAEPFFLVHGFLSGGQRSAKVFSAQEGFALLHTFPFWVDHVAMISESEYYFTKYSGKRDTAWLYGPDFQLAKVLLLPTNTDAPGNWNHYFTKSRFANNDLLECVYTRRAWPENVYETRCVDETGEVLFEFPFAVQGAIDHREGMADKFFVKYPDRIEVFRFEGQPTAAPEAEAGSGMLVYPNPFQESLQIALLRCGDWHATLYDQFGRSCRSLYRNACETLDMKTNDLPSGTYYLRMTSSNGKSYACMVIKGN